MQNFSVLPDLPIDIYYCVYIKEERQSLFFVYILANLLCEPIPVKHNILKVMGQSSLVKMKFIKNGHVPVQYKFKIILTTADLKT